MADFTLPRPRRREPTIPLSLPTVPGQMPQSRAGIQGFLGRLPASINPGPPDYQAGIDQSRAGNVPEARQGMAEQLHGLTMEQQQSLAAHKAYREGLKATQQQVDTRNNDLNLAQNLLIATDPNGDPAVRKFMLAGLSQASGVDPKGEYSQNIQKMVMGMKPEALEALRGSFTDDISNSPPGMIQKKLNGIFSGDVPIEHVLAQVKEYSDKKAAATAALTSPGLPLTSGAPAGGAAAESAPAPADELPGGEDAGAGHALAVGAKPSAQQRQEVLAAAANLPPTDPATAAAAEAAGAGPQPQQPQAPPEVPIEPSTPPDFSPEPPVGSASAQPAPAVEPAAAAAGEAAGAGSLPATPVQTPPAAETPPTPPAPATPPEPTSRMEVPDSLRKAAEETGDKLLLDAIAKIDARNAVLDSDASHRRANMATAGVSGAAIAGAASRLADTTKASAGDIAEAHGAPGQTPSPVGATAGTGGRMIGAAAGIPEESATGVIGKALDLGKEHWQALNDFFDRQGITPDSQVQMFKDVIGYKTPEERKANDQKVEAENTRVRAEASKAREEAAAAAPSPGEMAQKSLTQANAQNRKNQETRPATVYWAEKKDRPEDKNELTGAQQRALSPWLNPDVKDYTIGDGKALAPGLTTDPKQQEELNKALVHRDVTKPELYDAAHAIYGAMALARGDKLVGGVTLAPGWTVTGVLGLGGTELNPAAQAALGARTKAAGGFTDEQYDKGVEMYKTKVIDQILGRYKDMSEEQKLNIGTTIATQLMRLEAQVAIQQNPGRAPTNDDRAAARRLVGDMNFSKEELYTSIRTLLQNTDARLSAEVGAALGNTALGASMASLPREKRDEYLAMHPKLAEVGRPLLTPQQIRDMQEQNRKEDDRAAGVAPKENDYLVTKGGIRPQDYYDAQQTERGEKISQERAQKSRDEERLQLAKDHFKFEMMKFEEAQKRQAMLDARHAQEKMAAAFQHIGSIIAGSVKGGHIGGGGTGIGAGGEDAGAFRIAPSTQRQAPRIGGVQVPTRYGGPIKRMQ